jgi:hypothetical protein
MICFSLSLLFVCSFRRQDLMLSSFEVAAAVESFASFLITFSLPSFFASCGLFLSLVVSLGCFVLSFFLAIVVLSAKSILFQRPGHKFS